MMSEKMFDPQSPLVPIIRRALRASASGLPLERKIRSIYRQLADSYADGAPDQEGMIQELAARLSRVLSAASRGGGMERQVHRETVRL